MFEKRLNLHLYIPPPPPPTLPIHQGYSRGLCTAPCFRIFTLCSSETDNIKQTKFFFKRLIARDSKGNEIQGLFHKAIARAKTYNGPTTKDDLHHNNVILHLPFHLNDPASFRIQAAWRTHVAKLQWKMPLEHMKNQKTKANSDIERLIIAYKHPMNLGNLLSHRDLATGHPVSSYLYD